MTEFETGLIELFVYGGALMLALICTLKGKHWFGLFALFTYVVGLVGAIRLAKPSSHWARRYYSAEKMKLAMERFPEDAEGVALDPAQRTATPVGYWLGGLAIAIAAAMGVAHS